MPVFWLIRNWGLMLVIASSTFSLRAQSDTQLWLDFQTSYPFANRYLLENTASYQTLLSQEGKWRNISISPTFEYSLFRKLDFLSEIPLGYTNQQEGTSSFEVSPMIGARFYVTQNRRVETRLVWRHQTRAFRQIEANDWDISNRTRLRAELFLCLNGPNLSSDNLWSAFLHLEEFFVYDQQVDERYANRRRGQTGLGYRLNYKHRFEVSFTLQSSRNELEGEFISTDNVIQAKYKLYFNQATPAN